MKNKWKPLIIALASVAALLLVAAGVWFFWLKDYLSAAGAPPVYVNPISSIVGLNTGASPKYSGVVEPQETYEIKRDESKTVAEVLVKEGDEVHVGDLLFRYDNADLEINLRQANIALEGYANQIATLKKNITDLEAEKKKADQDEQYAYTVEIQDKQLQVEQLEYESTLKKDEITKLQESIANVEVHSEVEGTVKEVNLNPGTDSSGRPSPFISVLSTGDFRVKGTVSELNISSLTEGQAVTVHSRVSSEMTWQGVVDSIDREPAANDNMSGVYWSGMDSGESSSKYNFYVVLDNPEGLILGQHVYIELFQEDSSQKSGLWLPAVYVDHDEHGSFVWAKNDKDKLEKRSIILGEYDSDNDMYEIKSGATLADSIAYPSDTLRPGMPTTMDAAYQDAYMNGGSSGSFSGEPGMMDPAMDPAINNGLDGDIYSGASDNSYYEDGNYGEDGVYGGGDTAASWTEDLSGNEEGLAE